MEALAASVRLRNSNCKELNSWNAFVSISFNGLISIFLIILSANPRDTRNTFLRDQYLFCGRQVEETVIVTVFHHAVSSARKVGSVAFHMPIHINATTRKLLSLKYLKILVTTHGRVASKPIRQIAGDNTDNCSLNCRNLAHVGEISSSCSRDLPGINKSIERERKRIADQEQSSVGVCLRDFFIGQCVYQKAFKIPIANENDPQSADTIADRGACSMGSMGQIGPNDRGRTPHVDVSTRCCHLMDVRVSGDRSNHRVDAFLALRVDAVDRETIPNSGNRRRASTFLDATRTIKPAPATSAGSQQVESSCLRPYNGVASEFVKIIERKILCFNYYTCFQRESILIMRKCLVEALDEPEDSDYNNIFRSIRVALKLPKSFDNEWLTQQLSPLNAANEINRALKGKKSEDIETVNKSRVIVFNVAGWSVVNEYDVIDPGLVPVFEIAIKNLGTTQVEGLSGRKRGIVSIIIGQSVFVERNMAHRDRIWASLRVVTWTRVAETHFRLFAVDDVYTVELIHTISRQWRS
ncbi:hypothetical protein G5I_10826 [Acromyrmex echinatior]|uniref:Uncharacterized protein n=1 Tax=Acromyrmex echinatior TaxID=103372 RepID=F4WXX2_ACREC|nr:hypothetical protein G5I_10826 [Acromyrmex echinatior]